MSTYNVKSGVTSTGMTLLSSDGMYVSSGGTAMDTTLDNGHMIVYARGETTNTKLLGSATLFLSSGGGGIPGGIALSTYLEDDSYMIIYSSALASETHISGGKVYLSSGGSASGTYISGGSMDVYGWAQNTVISAGSVTFASGGTAFHVTAYGGIVNVASEATVRDLNAHGGTVNVFRNTILSGASIDNGGSLEILTNGFASETYVGSGGVVSACGDGTAINTGIGSGGTMTVLSAGTANNTSVGSGGTMNVLAGGTANVVKAYGTVNMSASAVLASVSILGGALRVHSGAQLNSMTVQNGKIVVLSGGLAVANRATQDGRISAGRNGRLSGCVAISSGRIELEGGSALATEIGAAGIMLVEGTTRLIGVKESDPVFGIASNTRIHLGAVASIGSGGAMIDTVVGYSSASLNPREPKINDLPSVLLERAGLYINSSGIASGVTASKGAIVAVANQGLIISAKVSSGASAQILAGGSARTLSILRGGSASIKGTATAVNIASAATAVIGNGGSASTVTVSAGGTLRAEAGARLAAVSVASGGIVTGRFAGLAAQAVTLTDGILDFDVSDLGADEICVDQLNTAFAGTYSCTLTVGDEMAEGTYRLAADAAGFEKSITVQDASGETLGTLTVGGTTNIGGVNYKLNLDTDNLLSVQVRAADSVDITGDLTSAFILTDGMVGSSVNVFTSDGRLVVSSGAVAAQTTAYQSGSLIVYEGGSAGSTTVGSGGKFYVSSGGSADNTTVNSNASMTVVSGTVDHTTINGGNMYLYTQAVANNTTIDNYAWVVVRDGTANNTVVKDSYLIIGSEGIANSTSISSRAALLLQSGGTANNTTVNSDGELIISSGCTAISTLVFGGQCTVSRGGTAINTLVSSGFVFFQEDATASSTTIYSGGNVYVSSGVTAKDTVLNGGKLKVSSDGTVTGRLTIETGAIFSAEAGSILDFDLTQTSAGATALVNDISRVTGTPLYTLTVDGTQANGVYILAGGAAAFAGTITVQNTSRETLGTLTVGGTTNIGGVDYTLALGGDNVLSVSVVGAVAPVGTAKSDVDGNGVSDVMFVWTGEHGEGNYQHGYWMNGTSEWRSAGSNHPAEWDNLGCHDMTGDGKADSVLFGNVTTEAGIKGAYVGYYADANDLPDGSTWVNIGYLTNEDDIDWKNTVGNLTGSESGVNSIVWYTHELGALGAWTDGTDAWVNIAGGFDATWSLVGCGDFDGDGADSVVMSLNSGANYYAVALDGTFTDLGVSDSGWAVQAIGDFAGDGIDDIVAFHKETGIVAMWGDGLSANWSQLGQLDASDWFVVGCGDYNADAKDDLLVRQYSTGMLGYYSSGDMSNWNVLGYGVDMSWTVIA